MKRRTKKYLINQPTGLSNIEFDELDESGGVGWETNVSGPKSRRFNSLRKRAHSKLSAIHSKHFNRNSR
jgi:hypothetical protein